MRKPVGLALGLLSLVHADCFNTSGIKNGGLQCAPDGTCPDGFRCVKDGPSGQPGHCWRSGTGPDAAAGAGRDAFRDTYVAPVCGPPYGPFPNCRQVVPAESACDPVCQAGCECGRRCILDPSTNSTFVCEESPSAPGTTFIQPAGECGGPDQALCAPGSVCITDPACPNLCYKTCRVSGDCPDDSRCTASMIVDNNSVPIPNLFLCSPPVKNCNPTGAAECLPRRANFKCVFLAGLTGALNDSSTVCDCVTLHYKKVGEKCAREPDDCEPGSVCVNGTCRLVCLLKTSLAPCPSATAICTPLYGSTLYGYCP